MNILHLKYAVEVAKAKSLNKAAGRLYVAQPNISRAIRELEASIGIVIFERTARGVTVTPEGAEFLYHAQKVLDQLDALESVYRQGPEKKQRFSVSAPRAAYICQAFQSLTAKLPPQQRLDFSYRETNAFQCISDVLEGRCRLGILRYARDNDRYFKAVLEERNLAFEAVTELRYAPVFHQSHPLAANSSVTLAELEDCTEVAYGDSLVPSLQFPDMPKLEGTDYTRRRILVFDRASRLELLCGTPGAYFWDAPMPQATLDSLSLVQLPCADDKRVYRDLLIYHKDYQLSALDSAFLEEVNVAKQNPG